MKKTIFGLIILITSNIAAYKAMIDNNIGGVILYCFNTLMIFIAVYVNIINDKIRKYLSNLTINISTEEKK